MTRDNLPWPNCNRDGKADNKRQAFINTDTRRFKNIQTGNMGPPPPPLAGPLWTFNNNNKVQGDNTDWVTWLYPVDKLKYSFCFLFKTTWMSIKCSSETVWVFFFIFCQLVVFINCHGENIFINLVLRWHGCLKQCVKLGGVWSTKSGTHVIFVYNWKSSSTLN